MTPREAAHYRVLRLIEEQPEVSQRELARALGISLGKTHYLLKAMLDKGLVKADNFRRSDNKLAKAEKQEAVTNCDHLSRLKYSPAMPYAFTEHGALMLGSVLKSDFVAWYRRHYS